ncbi:sugar phosphate isomerase/epimerase family protein [Cohnella candidum]|uniref:Sugar phosphate isomerase/epimerase n=1 Tax=Cohnella candidum TaxID=2674991 RepID=A0A3G3K1W9_9BACL|nr:sugar phosphate isomerase/epimerase [Cohnella candidum]AYQ74161.1 sugar phosphate isomerase/epimerase [Cohnella candidum]
MKLAISNIAWSDRENEDINRLLDQYGVDSIEVAPTKIWPDPIRTTLSECLAYRSYWSDRTKKIVSMQSLLFGRPDLTLFGDEQSRENAYEYLAEMIRLGTSLGAKAFVFGSPKNRSAGSLSSREAYRIAIPFFERLGEVARSYEAKFCVEPNPAAYGCDFIRNTDEGIDLVKAVGHPGFGLHLDAAAMALNEENVGESLEKAFPVLAHFHISEPYLQKVPSGQVNHAVIASQLKQLQYSGYVSIEMKDGLHESNAITVKECLDYATGIYLG